MIVGWICDGFGKNFGWILLSSFAQQPLIHHGLFFSHMVFAGKVVRPMQSRCSGPSLMDSCCKPSSSATRVVLCCALPFSKKNNEKSMENVMPKVHILAPKTNFGRPRVLGSLLGSFRSCYTLYQSFLPKCRDTCASAELRAQVGLLTGESVEGRVELRYQCRLRFLRVRQRHPPPSTIINY